MPHAGRFENMRGGANAGPTAVLTQEQNDERYAALQHKHPAFDVGAPVARTVALGAAYKASTPTKPALVSIDIECAATISLHTPQANAVELIIGAANTVAAGTGTRAGVYRNDLTLSSAINLGFTSRHTLRAFLPAGWWFAVRRTAGTGSSIAAAFDQALG